MKSSKVKKIICLDFDGVVHSYEKGWQDGTIYGKVTPGFFSWLMQAQEEFNIVIYSSRSKTPEGRLDMGLWLEKQFADWRSLDIMGRGETKMMVTYAHEKPSAWLTIDDRAVCFMGDWTIPELTVEAMKEFTPWNL